jgi:plastocyanin
VPSGSAAPTALAAPTAAAANGAPLRVATAISPARATVRIVDYAFTPRTISVRAGGTVIWTNTGSDRHSVAFATGESPRLDSGQTFEKTFAAAGQYAYKCGIHPSMTGVVTVTAASASVGTPAKGPSSAGPAGSAAPTDRPTAAPTTRPTATSGPTATHADDDRDDDDFGRDRQRGRDGGSGEDRSGSNSGPG